MFYLDDSITTENRYDMIKFFNFDVDNIDCLTSFFGQNLRQLPVYGTITVTEEEHRPDMLSYKIYQDTQYWWLLLWYNSILNVNDLVAGLSINYPAQSTIEEFYILASNLKKTELTG